MNRAVVSLFGLTCAYRNKITQSVKIWSKWAMGFFFFFAFAVLSGIQTCREVKLFPKLLVHFVKMQVSNNQHNWPKHHITCKLFFVFETMFKMMFFLQKWLLQKFNFFKPIGNVCPLYKQQYLLHFYKVFQLLFQYHLCLGVGCGLFLGDIQGWGSLHSIVRVWFFPFTLKCLSKCRDTTDKRATAVLNTNCCFN